MQKCCFKSNQIKSNFIKSYTDLIRGICTVSLCEIATKDEDNSAHVQSKKWIGTQKSVKLKNINVAFDEKSYILRYPIHNGSVSYQNMPSENCVKMNFVFGKCNYYIMIVPYLKFFIWHKNFFFMIPVAMVTIQGRIFI